MFLRLKEWPVRIWCRLTGGLPVWVKADDGKIMIKIARRLFDPFDDEPPLTIKHKDGRAKLMPNGNVNLAYGVRWQWKHARRDLHVEEVLKR